MSERYPVIGGPLITVRPGEVWIQVVSRDWAHAICVDAEGARRVAAELEKAAQDAESMIWEVKP